MRKAFTAPKLVEEARLATLTLGTSHCSKGTNCPNF